MSNNIYEDINQVRALMLDKDIPESLADAIDRVCDLAEEKADSDQQFIEFGGF